MFWILFIVINMSGNLAFSLILPYKPILILLFSFLLYIFLKNVGLKVFETSYLLFWLILLLLQATYTSDTYSFSSTFHAFLKISIGIFTISLLKDKFIDYYCNIIYFFCILSLIGFFYNSLGYVIPYLPAEAGEIDGGKIFRVSSIIYTQLYNLDDYSLTLRNCGPFWEPGAFQGFINLALILEIFKNTKRSKLWYVKVFVYVISILTTFSTGGYIVLFINLLYLLYSSKMIDMNFKIIVSIIFLIVSTVVFLSTDFLYQKISADNSRLGVGVQDILNANLFSILFGYGFAAESFGESAIKSVSSIFNLVLYAGVSGFLLYFLPIVGVKLERKRLFFTIIIILIMMNEPFITTGPFWWSIPFLWTYIMENKKYKEAQA